MLIGVVVWNENNEIELSSDGDKTLKNFLHYRRKILVKEHPNDNAQLLTKEQFEGGVVGSYDLQLFPVSIQILVQKLIHKFKSLIICRKST